MNPFTKDISEKYGGLRAINADLDALEKQIKVFIAFVKQKILGVCI